ncbi:hypothetical protein HK405_012505 [Cladochytrium tenue]|nr:hypothetical protein HK405_012505 [Cladochytrium tenue]
MVALAASAAAPAAANPAPLFFGRPNSPAAAAPAAAAKPPSFFSPTTRPIAGFAAAAAAASSTANPVSGCTAAIAALQNDLTSCSASKSSSAFYACVCAIGSLASDIQFTLDSCPATAYTSYGMTTNGFGDVTGDELYSTCSSLGYTLASLTNAPTGTASISSSATNAASTSSANPVSGCTAAIGALQDDLTSCSASTSTDYYACVCGIKSLAGDIQFTLNSCPASAYTTYGMPSNGFGDITAEDLYATCNSLGSSLASLTNLPSGSATPAQSATATASSTASASTSSANPVSGCTAAIGALQDDLAACSASTSADYYACVCGIKSLVGDIQFTLNSCPASAYTTYGMSTNGYGEITAEDLYATCSSLGSSLTSLTNLPTATASGSVLSSSATGSSSATTSPNVVSECTAAIGALQDDFAACASSANFSSASSADYYTCICATKSLITDIQYAFNVCPAAAFESGTTSMSATAGDVYGLQFLYDKCQ